MARSYAREIAFCLLFEKTYNVSTLPESYDQLFENNQLDKKDLDYISKVLHLVELNQSNIDIIISNHSKNWKISRIPRADISILRLAICEMNYIDDVPAVVAINEAIELAKKYCNDDAFSFINGILGAYLKQL